MKSVLVGCLVVLGVFGLTGCEKSEKLSPILVNDLSETTEKESTEAKIEALTMRLEALQAEVAESAETEEMMTERSASEEEEVSTDEPLVADEIAALLHELEALRADLAEESPPEEAPIEEGDTPAGCTFAGETLEHEQSRNYFNTENVAHGSACESAERSCNNGTMTGNIDYEFNDCVVDPAPAAAPEEPPVPGSIIPAEPATLGGMRIPDFGRGVPLSLNCELDGVTLNHGDSQNFFNTRTVIPTLSCLSSVRTCNNGALEGHTAFKFAECERDALASCTLDGLTVTHGGSAAFYLRENTFNGAPCVSRVRNCENGTLEGNVTYRYASCTRGAVLVPEVPVLAPELPSFQPISPLGTIPEIQQIESIEPIESFTPPVLGL